MRARVHAAAVATLLACAGACAQRVAPAPPGPDSTDTAAAGAHDPAEPDLDPPARGEEQAKQALRQLFEHCAASAYERAAAYFLYDGSDESRRNQAALSTEEPGEAAAVEARCKNLAGILESSGGYAIVGHERDEEGGRVWHRVRVSFSTPGAPTKHVFSLLEVGDSYLLGAVE